MLITGAGRGIGRAVALTLAQTGWEVHAAVRRVEDGESLVHDAPANTITPLPLDVTDSAQIAALEEALPRRLDAVINNAGIVVDLRSRRSRSRTCAASSRSTSSARWR